MDRQAQGMPGIANALMVIGILTIIGGVIICAKAWPGDPGAGYTWKFSAYVPALTWLFSAIISGVLFFAGAAALTYLRDIREYLRTSSTTEKQVVQDVAVQQYLDREEREQ